MAKKCALYGAEFRSAAEEVCAGKITFLQFHVRAKDAIDRVVRNVVKNWPIPPWETAEDIRQELLLIVWKHVESYDPKRGQHPADYISIQSRFRLERRLLSKMGVSTHRPANSKGKFWRDYETEQTAYIDGEGRPVFREVHTTEDFRKVPVMRDAGGSSWEDIAIEREERAERYDDVLSRCDTTGEMVAVTAMERYGDVDESARGILRSQSLADECGVRTFEGARALVHRTLRRLTAEAGGAVS